LVSGSEPRQEIHAAPCKRPYAIEGIGDETHRRSAIEGGYLVGARDVVAAQFLRNIRTAPGSLGDGFETFRVIYFVDFDDHINGWFGLGMESLNRRRTTPARTDKVTGTVVLLLFLPMEKVLL
jgi:hypothetical protein